VHLTAVDFATALLWSAVAGVAAWLALWPLRRRSFTGLLVSLVLVGAAASTGAVFGAVHAMIVSWDWRAVIGLSLFAWLIAGIAALAAARRVSRDAAVLRRDVAELAEGRVPDIDGTRLPAEVQQVRRELHETAIALAETRQREQALEASRRELVSWVSHDLRTPLAGLRAMAEALEDGVPDDPGAYYKQIGAEVDRLNRMVEDLFDLSRIQAGVLSPTTERVDLDDLASDVIAALTPLAAARDVALHGTVAARVAVDGSGAELGRAVTNLVVNAIRHTPSAGRVDITVGHAPDGKRQARLTVADECGGIAPDIVPRIFDVGFRGEPARTPPAPGLTGAGLGLAITRGIVEAHGGTVDVANIDGGCRFSVLLPAS
jgi:signal transduction histidine kinase